MLSNVEIELIVQCSRIPFICYIHYITRSSETYKKLGSDCYRQQDYIGALEHYNKAIGE